MQKAKSKDADQLHGKCVTDQRFHFRSIQLVLFLYFLNPKFEASSHPYLWSYGLFSVWSGLKLQRQVSLQHSSYEPRHEKTNNVDSYQVKHKPSCTATGDG